MQPKEVWRRIHNAPNYEVSNLGRVRSHLPYRNNDTSKLPHLLKPSKDKDGYKKVILRIDGKRKDFRIAVLVAEAWHGPRPEGQIVRHLDGSKANDIPKNLKWGTPKENSYDAKQHGTYVHGARVQTCKLKENDVKTIKRSTESHAELAKKFNVSIGAIWHIRAGRTWKHVDAGHDGGRRPLPEFQNSTC